MHTRLSMTGVRISSRGGSLLLPRENVLVANTAVGVQRGQMNCEIGRGARYRVPCVVSQIINSAVGATLIIAPMRMVTIYVIEEGN